MCLVRVALVMHQRDELAAACHLAEVAHDAWDASASLLQMLQGCMNVVLLARRLLLESLQGKVLRMI